MKKTITTLTICGLTVLGAATTTQAGSPTCADLGWTNHGEHVRDDYVFANDPQGARGGPSHRVDGVFMAPPGASFCLDQANSPGR